MSGESYEIDIVNLYNKCNQLLFDIDETKTGENAELYTALDQTAVQILADGVRKVIDSLKTLSLDALICSQKIRRDLRGADWEVSELQKSQLSQERLAYQKYDKEWYDMITRCLTVTIREKINRVSLKCSKAKDEYLALIGDDGTPNENVLHHFSVLSTRITSSALTVVAYPDRPTVLKEYVTVMNTEKELDALILTSVQVLRDHEPMVLVDAPKESDPVASLITYNKLYAEVASSLYECEDLWNKWLSADDIKALKKDIEIIGPQLTNASFWVTTVEKGELISRETEQKVYEKLKEIYPTISSMVNEYAKMQAKVMQEQAKTE